MAVVMPRAFYADGLRPGRLQGAVAEPPFYVRKRNLLQRRLHHARAALPRPDAYLPIGSKTTSDPRRCNNVVSSQERRGIRALPDFGPLDVGRHAPPYQTTDRSSWPDKARSTYRPIHVTAAPKGPFFRIGPLESARASPTQTARTKGSDGAKSIWDPSEYGRAP